MDNESIFFTLFIVWCFSFYGPPYKVFLFLRNIFQKTSDVLNFVKHFNHLMSSQICIDEFESDNTSEKESNENRSIIKYEDKYLTEFRKMTSEPLFDEREQKLKDQKYIDFLNEMRETYTNKIDELKNIVETNNAKLNKYKGSEEHGDTY